MIYSYWNEKTCNNNTKNCAAIYTIMSVPINRRGSFPILSMSAQQKQPPSSRISNGGGQKEKPPLIRRISEECGTKMEVRSRFYSVVLSKYSGISLRRAWSIAVSSDSCPWNRLTDTKSLYKSDIAIRQTYTPMVSAFREICAVFSYMLIL